MSKKILIVDDSATIRQQVSFALTKDGYEVIEAVDGLDGVAKTAAHKDIAMVISDVNMPNMNGIDMLKKLKDNGFAPPIVMLTTEGSSELIETAKKIGVKGWLVKPFKPEQLVAVVKKLAA